MSSRVGARGGGFRRALTSRSARVLISAMVVATFAWRGYVLCFATSGRYEGRSAGIWLLVNGIYLLLRSTWWKQPRAEAGELLPDRSRASASSSR